MAYTNLSDMIVPAVLGRYVTNNIIKTNRFVQSGILTPDTALGPQLTQAGSRISVPFINDLSGDADNWVDGQDIAVNSLTSGKQEGIKFYRDKAFGYTDLTTLISGAPVQEQIGNRFAQFWVRQDQKLLLQVLKGIFGNTDIAAAKLFDQTVKSPTDAQFGPKGFLAAIGLMGDLQDTTFGSIAVNSATYSMMKSQGLIETLQPQNGATPFTAYNGLRIVLDDDIETDLTDKTKPTTTAYVFGSGAVSYSTVMKSTETQRDALKSGGQDAIVQKRIGTIHVQGTSVKSDFSPAIANAVSDAELAASTTWEVVDGIDPRNIQVVAYKAQLDPMFVPGATVATTTGNTGN
ncbi:replication protein [Lactiplantibacillus plantarum]|uniref:replication protein n=1 Tax=Lactiplantibacillus plantarum TaxID=1590 RepID=UPI00295BB875|nr:replication protein [Lactiplantibacillus plantarum]MDV9115403.1 replication protein [Lactiplantibacillus plantarum]